MQSLVFVILLALLGGIAVGIQSPLASLISQRLGLLESIFIVHVGGALCVAVPLILMRGGQLSAWQRVPWYALGAGVFGLVVIGAVSAAMPRVGASATIILIVAGQLIVGVLIDQFGLLYACPSARSVSRGRIGTGSPRGMVGDPVVTSSSARIARSNWMDRSKEESVARMSSSTAASDPLAAHSAHYKS